MEVQAKLIWGAAGILGASLIVAAYIAAPPRFEIATVSNGAYRLDRSTGAISLCVGAECRPVLSEAETFQAVERRSEANVNLYQGSPEDAAAWDRAREQLGMDNSH